MVSHHLSLSFLSFFTDPHYVRFPLPLRGHRLCPPRPDVLRDVERNMAAQVKTPQVLLLLALALSESGLAEGAGDR